MRWVLVVMLLMASESARADDKPAPMAVMGLRLLDDLRLKWAGTLPELAAFDEQRRSGWDAWAVVDGEASLAQQTGRLRLGLGIGRLGWRLDSTTIVEGTAARVKLRLALDLGAAQLRLQLPDVKVTPRFDKGQLGADVIVPLLEERF